MLKKNIQIILIFFVFYFVWSVVIPFIFKINIENIETAINKFSNCRIELGSVRLKTASIIRAGISTDEIKILDGTQKTILSVTQPRVNISLLPLLVGKVRVNSFECRGLESTFMLSDKLYFGDFPISFGDAPVDFKIKRVKIKKHCTIFKQSESKQGFVFEGKDFYYKESANSFILIGNNKICAGDNQSQIDFNIFVPKKHRVGSSRVNFIVGDLEFRPFVDLAKIISSEVISIDGNANFICDNSRFEGRISDFRLITKDGAKSIVFPRVVDISSLFSFKSDDVYIKNFELKTEGVNFEMVGNINNLTSSTPEIGLKLRGGSIDARTVAKMLPPVVVPQFNFYRLKMYPFYGKADFELAIRGKCPEPSMDGNIHVYDAYMIRPIANAKGADINIKCIRKKMNVDVVVPAGNGETVYVTGDIDDYGDNKSDLKIRSTKRVNLSTAQFVLNPLHQILRFPIGPVPIMDISGFGNIDIRVLGTKKDPHIWGDFNFIDTSASFKDLHHLVLKNASGNLNFNDRDAHFINHTGTVNGKRFVVDGICTLFGNIDFDVRSEGQPLDILVKTLKDSPMLEEVQSIIPDIKDCKNWIDLNLKLTGKLPNIYHIKLGENLFAEGDICFHNNDLRLMEVPIKHLFGGIKFKNLDVDLDLNSTIGKDSRIDIVGGIRKGIANLVISSSRLNLCEFSREMFPELDDCFVKFRAKYQGDVKNIRVKNIECSGEVLRNDRPISNIKIIGGRFDLSNSCMRVRDFNGFIKQHPFYVDLKVSNITDELDLKKSRIDGGVFVDNFDLTTLNDFKKFKMIPSEVSKVLDNVNIENGVTDIRVKINNNKLDGDIELNNINFRYDLDRCKNSIPIKLINGVVKFRGNKIILDKMNYLVDTMPVLVYGDIGNIFKTPMLNIHINSKLLQRTFDKYWNVDNIYPIKVRGDILLGSWITGTLDRINTKIDCKMEANSSIYYMGAMIGDVENPIVVNSDFDILNNNTIRLNKFDYSKLISSLNNKQNLFPLLRVKGGITYNEKFYRFDDLVVKTSAPTDARVFNILFKKPTIKYGQFTSDLRINGTSNNPIILGDMKINGIDMPFLNTTIKDLSLDFSRNSIAIRSKGEVLSNNILFNAKMRNRFNGSYDVDFAEIYTRHLDINNLLSNLKQVELKTFNEGAGKKASIVENTNLLNSVLFKELVVHADNVSMKQLTAKNLVAKCSVDEDMNLSVKHFDLDVSDGRISGSGNLNMLSNILRLNVNAFGIDSNDLLSNFFDLPNQIFGKLTGSLNLVTNVSNERSSKEKLSGNIVFRVTDGRMPKLGSLEYLLRASNVFKSGVTGFTINSVIELVSPLKTGEFSNIDGSIILSNGIAEKIELHSMGKALNLYIKGSHNLITQIADISVLGQLSKNASTVLGTVGNISLNSLFNKIPGIDLNEDSRLRTEFNKIPGIEITNKKYRKFVVDIYGDINTDDNVKTFRWIN